MPPPTTIKSKSSFDKDNFKEHYIDYIKGTLLLPHEYQELTVENRPYLFSSLDSTSALVQIADYLDRDRVDYKIFSKESNSEDIIFITKSEHINFSKRDANQYLGMLESNLKSGWGHLKYDRIENKMSQTERSKYIKIKYKLESENSLVFQTQYIVTSPITTFQVIELHHDILDNEELIKRVNYIIN